MFGAPQNLKPPAELTTDWLNKLLMLVRKNTINLGVNSGLSMIQSEAGTFLRASGKQTFRSLAVTSTAVGASVKTGTGTSTQMAEGQGSVYLLVWSETDSAWIVDPDDDDQYDVINLSTTTAGIPVDTLVWIESDDADNWFITAVDCGN